MSSAAVAVLNSRLKRIQRGRNDHLALLLLLIAGVLALMAVGEQRGAPVSLIARILALLPITVAAANYRSRPAVWLVAAVFSTACLPAMASEGLVSGNVLLGWVSYTLLLFFFAWVASMLATVLHTRRMLTGVVRDWESLFVRALSLDEVSLFVGWQASEIAGAGDWAILLRNPATGEWELFCCLQDQVQRYPVASSMAGEEDAAATVTLAHWLIRQTDPKILNNLEGDPRLVMASPIDLRSLLTLPLHQPDGQIFAMLALANKRIAGFEQSDLEALAGLAAAARQALLKAGAFARTDDMLTRRMRQLSALQRSARDLNTPLDPQQIAREALAYAVEIAEGDAGLISVTIPALGHIVSQLNSSLSADQVSRLAESASHLAEPVQDVKDDEALPALLAGAGICLVVPLRRQGRTLGLIMVERAQPPGGMLQGHVFGGEVLHTLTSLADQAVAAFDKARLFEEMRSEKRKSEQIVANIADALFTVDAEERITSFNPAAACLTGWRVEEAFGHRVCDVLCCCPTGDNSARCMLLAALDQRSPVSHDQWTIRQRLGSQRVVSLSAAPLEHEGGPGGLVVLLHDVTEKRRMERLQQDLVTSFSHELRTPLAAIGAITQMLLADDGALHGCETDVHEHLLLLQAQSQRLEEYAERFLTVAQLEQEQMALEPEPLAIGALVQAVVQQWRMVHAQRVFAVLTPAQPFWVWADEQATRAVLEVLLDNACKYSSCSAPIEVQIALQAPDRVMVAVCDEGPGLAPEDQVHIFERFYRVDTSDARTVYGHGLGLYIARQLVQAMAGQVWVESSGAGSRFAFTLPLMHWEEDDEDPGN